MPVRDPTTGRFLKGGGAGPSGAVLAARGRRPGAAAAKDVRIQWFIKNVTNKVNMTMGRRVALATEHVRSKVVNNLKIPVTKSAGSRGGKIVTGRSKPGEFPHAETEQLMRTIFATVRSSRGMAEGFVGTPLDYGVILETRMNRSFLVRTLQEERGVVKAILTGPMKV